MHEKNSSITPLVTVHVADIHMQKAPSYPRVHNMPVRHVLDSHKSKIENTKMSQPKRNRQQV